MYEKLTDLGWVYYMGKGISLSDVEENAFHKTGHPLWWDTSPVRIVYESPTQKVAAPVLVLLESVRELGKDTPVPFVEKRCKAFDWLALGAVKLVPLLMNEGVVEPFETTAT